MMQQRVRFAPSPDRRHQDVSDELGRHRCVHRPANHTAGEEIDDGGQIEPALRCPHIGEFWKIVAWAGLLLAGALYMVEPLELLSTSVVPICFVTAESDAPAPAAIESGLTIVSGTTKSDGSAQLFGMDIEPVADGALLDKWRRVQADITKDLEVVAQCQAGKPCPAPAQRLIRLSLEGYGRSDRARVGVLNRAVDLAISPVSDETQWGVPDHWSDPLETLHSNSGDCEDYAIVNMRRCWQPVSQGMR
jgi:predicted transglutaminase-like cysteine proteinase